MKRTYPMTETAINATWSKISNGEIFRPDHFEISDSLEGEGYDTYKLDKDRTGFVIFKTSTIKHAKSLIEELNQNGVTPRVEKMAEPFSFSWKNFKIPV